MRISKSSSKTINKANSSKNEGSLGFPTENKVAISYLISENTDSPLFTANRKHHVPYPVLTHQTIKAELPIKMENSLFIQKHAKRSLPELMLPSNNLDITPENLGKKQKVKLENEESHMQEYDYVYPNGDKYKGGLLSGKPHGYGVKIYVNDGIKFEGNWCEGNQHGEGQIIYPNNIIFLTKHEHGKLLSKVLLNKVGF